MIAQIITENGQKKVIPLTADAGAGNPVGSLISMYKKSSPSGYLYCDGSTFDQTKYPLLYAYLGSNVLPDYREFALVGAEENTTDVYNASTNPNGIIHDHDVYAEGEAKDDQLQDHKHMVKKFDIQQGTGTLYTLTDYTTNENDSTITNVYTFNSKGRKGTVTRGKRKAVYFYIKATSGLSENAQDNVINTLNEERSYSTTEINTGKKWIDGKDIYRIVTVATLNQQVDSNAYKDTGAPLPSNVDTYIRIISTQRTGNCFYYSTSNATLYIAGIIQMNANAGTAYILEYTKSTT